jgi:hypothetical protein
VAPAWITPSGLDRERQRGGTGRDAHTVPNAAVRRELLLEALDLLAEDECAAGRHTLEGRAQLLHERLVLAPQVDERYAGRHRDRMGRRYSGSPESCRMPWRDDQHCL